MRATATTRKSEEFALLTRIEGDAPAARMMRRFWLPALWSEEVSEPDGAPVPVRLLGERYVAFRDSHGELGILDEGCPHRLASMALGRNEEGGLRCIFHGWKFDVRGRCLDMPTEPPDYRFADRMRIGAYPVREAGGIVWTYLGPPELEPAFPAFDWTLKPRSHVALVKFVEHANYLQAAEASIDSAHTRFLHRGFDPQEEARRNALSVDLAPRLEAADTTYGFRYVALRRLREGSGEARYAKSTRFVFPTTAVTSHPMSDERPALTQIFVPMDDEHTMHYTIYHSVNGKPLDEPAIRREEHLEPGVDLDRWFRPVRTAENWWGQDRAAMRRTSWTGIPGVLNQDAACQESMGPIVDRSREHLGTSDVAIIKMRKRLIESIKRTMTGGTPIGLEHPLDYRVLTHVVQRALADDEAWQSVDTFPGEYPAETWAAAR